MSENCLFPQGRASQGSGTLRKSLHPQRRRILRARASVGTLPDGVRARRRCPLGMRVGLDQRRKTKLMMETPQRRERVPNLLLPHGPASQAHADVGAERRLRQSLWRSALPCRPESKWGRPSMWENPGTHHSPGPSHCHLPPGNGPSPILSMSLRAGKTKPTKAISFVGKMNSSESFILRGVSCIG